MKTGDVNFEDITLFKDLPPTALDKIRGIFDVRSLDAGENLNHRGRGRGRNVHPGPGQGAHFQGHAHGRA